jgi:hypothetical protein
MKRFLFLSGLLLLVLIGVGGWMALRMPPAVLVAPGAMEIQVIQINAGKQLITYCAPGAPYAWRVAVVRNLEQRKWTNPLWWRPDQPLSLVRISRVGIALFWIQADLDGEPNVARITVRRWVEIPWWQYLPWHRLSNA